MNSTFIVPLMHKDGTGGDLWQLPKLRLNHRGPSTIVAVKPSETCPQPSSPSLSFRPEHGDMDEDKVVAATDELSSLIVELPQESPLVASQSTNLPQNGTLCWATPRTITDRLPVELLAMIFILCIPPFPPDRAEADPKKFYDEWLAVSQVCHRWRQIALGTSAFWATLLFDETVPGADIASEFLQRSREMPLSLRWHFSDGWGQYDPEELWGKVVSMWSAISKATHRLVHLQLDFVTYCVPRAGRLFPHIRHLDYCRLKSLSLSGHYDPDINRCLLEMVPAGNPFPSLETLALQNVNLVAAAHLLVSSLVQLDIWEITAHSWRTTLEPMDWAVWVLFVGKLASLRKLETLRMCFEQVLEYPRGTQMLNIPLSFPALRYLSFSTSGLTLPILHFFQHLASPAFLPSSLFLKTNRVWRDPSDPIDPSSRVYQYLIHTSARIVQPFLMSRLWQRSVTSCRCLSLNVTYSYLGDQRFTVPRLILTTRTADPLGVMYWDCPLDDDDLDTIEPNSCPQDIGIYHPEPAQFLTHVGNVLPLQHITQLSLAWRNYASDRTPLVLNFFGEDTWRTVFGRMKGLHTLTLCDQVPHNLLRCLAPLENTPPLFPKLHKITLFEVDFAFADNGTTHLSTVLEAVLRARAAATVPIGIVDIHYPYNCTELIARSLRHWCSEDVYWDGRQVKAD